MMASDGCNTSGYTTFLNNELDSEILRCEAGFTFVDFLPRVLNGSGFFTSATYESFRTLIDRANAFLRSNRKWKIVTCESVEFKSTHDKVDPYKMTYIEYESITFFVRGLRLWLTERKDEDEREQQIGYYNLIPQRLEKGGIFREAKFETLDALIERFNSMLQSNPLPGRVITVESQEMKVVNIKNFDPDRSNWSESGSRIKTFVFVLRIFYEAMVGSTEEIGVKDFIPNIISEGGVFSLPKYKCYSNAVNQASAWLTQQQDLRFCNAQTLEIKVTRGNQVNSQRMDYTESGSMTTFYVRVLRIAYTKQFSNSYSVSENPSPIQELTCRTFMPLQLTTGFCVSDYENLSVTRERVSAWVKATGAHVLSAETAAYRLMSGGERKYGTEATYTYNVSERNEYWIFVIRLYINGIYYEPPPEMLPPVPVIENNCCLLL